MEAILFLLVVVGALWFTWWWAVIGTNTNFQPCKTLLDSKGEPVGIFITGKHLQTAPPETKILALLFEPLSLGWVPLADLKQYTFEDPLWK